MTDTPKTLIITRVRDQARLTRSFDLRPAESADRVEFVPGQVAILGVGEEDPAYFAFASAPEDRDLEVLVKQKAGASKVLYDMREGDEIKLLGIAGRGFRFRRRSIETWSSSRWARVSRLCVQRCATS